MRAHTSFDPHTTQEATPCPSTPPSTATASAPSSTPGTAIVVEALPASYYEDAHIPGARNLPHDSDEAAIAAVLPDRDATVVVYCSNLACQNSTILSRRLVQLGFSDVREYERGKEDWIAAGLPVRDGRAGRGELSEDGDRRAGPGKEGRPAIVANVGSALDVDSPN